MRRYRIIEVLAVCILGIVLLLGYLMVRSHNDSEQYYKNKFAEENDISTEVALIIYEDYKKNRVAEDDIISYYFRDDAILRYGTPDEELEINKEQVDLTSYVKKNSVGPGVRGLMSTRAKNGYVIFEDHYGNKMIYSLDGSKPKIEETLGQFFNSSLYKLGDNWYFYQLVHY